MSDYQAIYDAVRSKISGGNIGDAVQEYLRMCNISHYAEMSMRACQDAASEYSRPSAVFRPRIFQDGNTWCALLGDNIQEGVCGFGESAGHAMYDFDIQWCKKIERNQPAQVEE